MICNIEGGAITQNLELSLFNNKIKAKFKLYLARQAGNLNQITLSTLFPTSSLMQSWFVEYRSISLAHISERLVNVSRRVTS